MEKYDNRIPQSLKYSQLLPSLKVARDSFSQPTFSQKQTQGIYTVHESLKDEYVLKNLDLPLGSLGQFMDLKSTDPNPILPNLRLNQRLRKKNEVKEEDTVPFGKKQNNAHQEKNPFELLKIADDEKVRSGAAKQIVQMIFKRIYGQDIEHFEEKNSKEALQQQYIDGVDHNDPKVNFIKKNSKIKRKERFELFEKQLNQSKTQSLKLKISENTVQRVTMKRESGSTKQNPEENEKEATEAASVENRSREKSRQIPTEAKHSPIPAPTRTDAHQLKSKMSFFGNNFTKMMVVSEPTFEQELQKLKLKRIESTLKLKSKFQNVHQVWKAYWKEVSIGADTIELLEAHKTMHQNVKQFFDEHMLNLEKNLALYQRLANSSDDQQIHKTASQEIVILNLPKQIIIRNVELTDDVVPWLIMETDSWKDLKIIEFRGTNLSQGCFKMLLNVILLECENLEHIDFSQNKISAQTCNLLEGILKKQKDLQIFILDLIEKLCCYRKLGWIVNNSSKFVWRFVRATQTQQILAVITWVINLDYSLDKRGLKPLETLLRYVKSLDRVDLSNNQLSDDNKEEKQKLYRQLNKIVLYNEGLKNKDIII